MNTTIIRGRLHEYIDRADKELLYAIYILLGKKVDPNSPYDQATLDILYKRVENDALGTSASYSMEETLEYIRAYKSTKQ